jgi:hypothetical protein
MTDSHRAERWGEQSGQKRTLSAPLFSSIKNAEGTSSACKFSLSDLLKLYEYKDEKTKAYLETHFVGFDKGFVSLAELNERAQKRAYSEKLNLINTFNLFAKKRNLNMAFITFTLKNHKFDSNDVRCLKGQSKVLRGIHRSMRDDILFRKPTERRKKRLGYKNDWYYIPPEKFQYIYALEMHQNYNLHSHVAYFIPSDKEAFIKMYELVKRKKEHFDNIGRVEYVVPVKFKKAFQEKFDLVRLKKTKYDSYFERGADLRRGDFLYIKFINDESQYNQDYFTQTMRYVSKYVMKGSGLNEDGTGSCRSKEQDSLIRYNRLRMISYSRTLFPFYVYSRFYKELQERDISLYDLSQMWQSGEAEFSRTIETGEEIKYEYMEFDSLGEYDDYINNLEYKGLIDFDLRSKHDDMWLKCYEEGDHMPSLVFECTYNVDNQTVLKLKLKDEELIFKNKLHPFAFMPEDDKYLGVTDYLDLVKVDVSLEKNKTYFNVF